MVTVFFWIIKMRNKKIVNKSHTNRRKFFAFFPKKMTNGKWIWLRSYVRVLVYHDFGSAE